MRPSDAIDMKSSVSRLSGAQMEADEARLVALFVGCSSSLGARGYGKELPETLRRAIPAAERHLRKKGRSFERIVAHKRERCIGL